MPLEIVRMSSAAGRLQSAQVFPLPTVRAELLLGGPSRAESAARAYVAMPPKVCNSDAREKSFGPALVLFTPRHVRHARGGGVRAAGIHARLHDVRSIDSDGVMHGRPCNGADVERHELR